MRIRMGTLVMVPVWIFILCTTVNGDGVRRYYDDEIQNLYQSSHYYFDLGDYHRAEKVLKRLDPHQYPPVLAHRDALRMLSSWSGYDLVSRLEDLERIGVPPNLLCETLCAYALEQHMYGVYPFCAKQEPRFAARVDEQIHTMLAAYYNDRYVPFHTFTHLSKLVNKDELSLNATSDANLLRQRIRAVIEDSPCSSDGGGCQFPAAAIYLAIGEFVYVR